MVDKRRRSVRAIAAVSVMIGTIGCSGPPPAESVAPDIQSICTILVDELDSLAVPDGRTPTVDDIEVVEDTLFAAFNALPDTDTTAGRPRSVIGSPLQQMRRALLDLMGIYNGRDTAAETAEVASELDLGLEGIGDGAAEFGVASCIETGEVRADLQVLLDGAEVVLADLAPTGDFDVDFAATCGRFRADVAGAVLETVNDPSGGLMGPVRAAGVMERFRADLDDVSPPPEYADRYDTLQTALDAASSAADRVLPAGQVSQEAVDDAIDDFVAAEAAVNEAIAAIDPTC